MKNNQYTYIQIIYSMTEFSSLEGPLKDIEPPCLQVKKLRLKLDNLCMPKNPDFCFIEQTLHLGTIIRSQSLPLKLTLR